MLRNVDASMRSRDGNLSSYDVQHSVKEIDLKQLWADAKRAEQEVKNAALRPKVKKPSKLKAAMEKTEAEFRESNRRLPRTERVHDKPAPAAGWASSLCRITNTLP